LDDKLNNSDDKSISSNEKSDKSDLYGIPKNKLINVTFKNNELYVEGTKNATIKISRGHTYYFRINQNIESFVDPKHGFIITDNPKGGKHSELIGFDPVASGCVPFIVENNKIDKLYYRDYNSLHNNKCNMGGLILVHD
jgi:hypothetical protein